jgi:hypothetical protein
MKYSAAFVLKKVNSPFLFIAIIFVLVRCSSYSHIFSKGKKLASITDSRLNEISGLVASRANKDLIWVHNDSGNKPEIYLVNKKLEIKMIIKIKDAYNHDWEDIAMGPGPDQSKNYIYLADVGDNHAHRFYKTIYRFEEPVLQAIDKDTTIINTVDTYDKTVFHLEDGRKDVEAMLVDPYTHYILIISKRENPATVYKVATTDFNDTTIAKTVMHLPIKKIVAADFSKDGKEVLIKTYRRIYYWNNDTQKPLEELLQGSPLVVRYKRELQGEAIGWAHDSKGFFTLGEKPFCIPSFLYYYKRTEE